MFEGEAMYKLTLDAGTWEGIAWKKYVYDDALALEDQLLNVHEHCHDNPPPPKKNVKFHEEFWKYHPRVAIWCWLYLSKASQSCALGGGSFRPHSNSLIYWYLIKANTPA